MSIANIAIIFEYLNFRNISIKSEWREYAADGKCVAQAACKTQHAYSVAVAAAVLWSWKRPLFKGS